MDRSTKQNLKNGYAPDLSIKKPSERAKVEQLEEAVKKGSLSDVKAVLETYSPFSFTARALGIASRYRGAEFVELLIKYGCTFSYEYRGALHAKYQIYQQFESSPDTSYRTDFCLMIVPRKLNFSKNAYGSSPLYGIPAINDIENLTPLSIKDKIEVLKVFNKYAEKIGVLMDEILFWALTEGEIEISDCLIDMGANLQKDVPSYHTPKCERATSFLTVITDAVPSAYWNRYLSGMASLDEDTLCMALSRVQTLAEKAGKKLAVSQKLFDTANWNEKSLKYILDNADISRVDKKSFLERVISKGYMELLAMLANSGWLDSPKRRESVITFAGENGYNEALAWLMNFKNRTVDAEKEAAKETERLFRSLTEDPNSVSALKRIWGYRKLSDGTLEISSYKGSDSIVNIPSKIGKNSVSCIGKYAFSALDNIRNKNLNRKYIKEITVPEGVTRIEEYAFMWCESLEKVVLPSTLEEVCDKAFFRCDALEEIALPEGACEIPERAIFGCAKLKR